MPMMMGAFDSLATTLRIRGDTPRLPTSTWKKGDFHTSVFERGKKKEEGPQCPQG